ncbi:MAG: hypothetical protein KGJ13_02035 [Patescibacteria group bacterium]|nr:hypothetical protein [Patescibacteria group bacterium]
MDFNADISLKDFQDGIKALHCVPFGSVVDIRFEERPIKRRKTKKADIPAPTPEKPVQRKQRAKKGGLEMGAVDGKTTNNTIFE